MQSTTRSGSSPSRSPTRPRDPRVRLVVDEQVDVVERQPGAGEPLRRVTSVIRGDRVPEHLLPVHLQLSIGVVGDDRVAAASRRRRARSGRSPRARRPPAPSTAAPAASANSGAVLRSSQSVIRVMKSAPTSRTQRRPARSRSAPRRSRPRTGMPCTRRRRRTRRHGRRRAGARRAAPCSASARPGSSSPRSRGRGPAARRPARSQRARRRPGPRSRSAARPASATGRSRIPVREMIHSSADAEPLRELGARQPPARDLGRDRMKRGSRRVPRAAPRPDGSSDRTCGASSIDELHVLERPLREPGQHPAGAHLDEPLGAPAVQLEHRLAPAHGRRQRLGQPQRARRRTAPRSPPRAPAPAAPGRSTRSSAAANSGTAASIIGE